MKKTILSILLSSVLSISFCMTAYAAPEVMPDGLGITDATSLVQNTGTYGDVSVIKLPKEYCLKFFEGPAPGASPYIYDGKEGLGFDEVRYAAEYPDVAASVGTSHAALWNHYKTKGFDEGRNAYYINVDAYQVYWDNYNKVNALRTAKNICNSNMSEYDKVRTVFNYVCSNCTYAYDALDQTTLDNIDYISMRRSGYGFWKYGQTICTGYSNVFQDFMNILGIQNNRNVSIPGHIYNNVYIDGNAYEIDCTWGKIGF